MPLHTLRSRGRALRLSTSFAVAALPLLLGIPLMYWQAATLLQNRAEKSAADASAQFERMLDDAARAADVVLPLAGLPCDDVVQTLRSQVAVSPFSRSINLVTDGLIYCTSLMGAYEKSEDTGSYISGQLRLMAGNVVTPDRAVLVYRQAKANHGVLVGIDGQHLINLLQINGQEVRLQIGVGNNWIRPDGHVIDNPERDATGYALQASSSRYPFKITAGYPPGATLQYMREHYQPQWLLFLILGALAGAGSYRLSLRATSPGTALKRAMEADEFIPHYQPVVEAETGQWHGVETLMRWQHPSEGLVPPNQFIPLAERLGLIVPMTRALMRHIREDFAGRTEQLPMGFHIGVNITAAHCRNLQLIDECRDFLAAFAPGQITLILELTERQMIAPTEITEQLFAELRQMGVRIAIDDFGTGHSSLAYLREFRVDVLKIDRSFISMIDSHSLSRHLLDNILDLSTRLQLDLVAEGVENSEQVEYLRQRGVRFLQGFHFARPMPAAPLFDTLRTPPTV
ncbi:EAL domain-containing protein [Phytopseudomonas punonensis]|uniref:cyclic-guanylate-specific phosphodiesterase n=1 Tax=Phytopseudomonas punonensis TaxID=1220495 RepID=A0A1M7P4C2_9GAMM|nr:EAL domain-containing protein [Pseudomonas punonensis]SHN11342.1 EAL domain, c-di-GMP-specific phosphodiesterase class I (or its enzymatically inactive variant) [Pseudomonas punonensis]